MDNKEIQVYVLDGVNVTTLYFDDLVALDLGRMFTRRATRIEPDKTGTMWKVTLTKHKLNGIWKGYEIGCFNTLKEAYAAEKKFLVENILNETPEKGKKK